MRKMNSEIEKTRKRRNGGWIQWTLEVPAVVCLIICIFLIAAYPILLACQALTWGAMEFGSAGYLIAIFGFALLAFFLAGLAAWAARSEVTRDREQKP